MLEILDEILVVDQGTQRVVDHPQYEEAQTALGQKLRMIEQGNLGGSGGFSRVMNEVASKGVADYVLLLDDDVVCELEGILRAVAFADLAKEPTLVGGQMFSLYDRSVLHAFGETVARYRWFWGPAPNTLHGHNFAVKPLRSTQWLHRRVDVDYNGWWMCLIPTKVIKEIGLSLPMFLKWDDAEFGLRAHDAGYPTVTLPGVAVWHVPWHEKDDTIDWQAYFHRRNRIIAALLHSPYERGGRLILESFETQIKHLLSMQYGPAEMGLMAIEDILEGPQRMHRDVLKRLPELFELRKGYDDSRSQTDLDLFPAAGRQQAAAAGQGADGAEDQGRQGQDAGDRRRAAGAAGPVRWPRSDPRRTCRTSTSSGGCSPSSTRRSSRRPTAAPPPGTSVTLTLFRDLLTARYPAHAGWSRSGRTSSSSTRRPCPSCPRRTPGSRPSTSPSRRTAHPIGLLTGRPGGHWRRSRRPTASPEGRH